MTEQYDALVIGGGPAGATAALVLARAGWSVCVAERKPFPRRKVCGEYLSATNLPLFDRLGIGAAFRDLAGPAVTGVGLFAGDTIVRADLPRTAGEWGRALRRESLDTLLLAEAARAGATVCQPAAVRAIRRTGGGYECRLEAEELTAAVVVAAHGSWDAGTLPTQPARRPPAPGDLLGFKAHFADADLPPGLMPLLVFPGGYGGMVHTDAGRVSLSCCVRRDTLAMVRRRCPGEAGAAVLAHIAESCAGVRRALDGARPEGPWLAAGPIRPGVRPRGRGGVLPVGNAAGEAHPVVAEGISMAIQSAWLLADRLIAGRREGALAGVADGYAAAWRRHFGPRVAASAAIAAWAMRPAAVAGALPLLGRFPAVLGWGARLSGKAARVV